MPLSKRQKYRLALTLEAARNSNVKSSQHGCVIFGDRNKVLATGSNRQVKQHSREYCMRTTPADLNDTLLTVHAEETALRQLKRSDRGRVKCVYVGRLHSSTEVSTSMSLPCARCQMRMRALKVPIYYSA